MAEATFIYKSTKQIITTNDSKKITKWKADPKWKLLEEEKRVYNRKPKETE